jgi:hypothetical protein
MADVNPQFFVWGCVFLAVMYRTARAFLMTLGFYKDPILTSFEHFGEERIYSPLYRLIAWSITLLYLSLFLYVQPGLLIVAGAIMLIPLVSLRETLQRLLYSDPRLYRAFPVWYRHLAERTTRTERRRIAYLWLRLPPRTRTHYNISQQAFHHWLDMVLVTMAR